MIACAPQVKTLCEMADHSFHPENLREAFAASLDWWADAGVLEHVEDAPSGWLKEAEGKGDQGSASIKKVGENIKDTFK